MSVFMAASLPTVLEDRGRERDTHVPKRRKDSSKIDSLSGKRRRPVRNLREPVTDGLAALDMLSHALNRAAKRSKRSAKL